MKQSWLASSNERQKSLRLTAQLKLSINAPFTDLRYFSGCVGLVVVTEEPRLVPLLCLRYVGRLNSV